MKLTKIVLIIFIILTGLSSFALNLSDRAFAASIDSESLMKKINAERTNRNIPTLLTSPKLSHASANKTSDMFARGYFDHVDPDGNYVWRLIEAAGYKPYRLLGENLAIDFSTEDGIIRAWIDSPTHRDNMLRAEFADQGLSARYGDFESRYTSLVTSLFGTLAVVSKPQPAPTPAPTETSPQPAPAPTPAPTPNPATTKNKTAPAETAPSKGQNEPAIQLTPITDLADAAAERIQAFNIINSKNLKTEDTNIYETVRWIFMILVTLLFFTIFADAAFHGKIKDIWKGHGFPVVLMLLITTLLTMTFY